jgi:orotate phosphoribosyltransferase
MRPQLCIDPIDTLESCGGVYQCPKLAGSEKRLGPLAGLAGTYETPEGPKQFVSDEYFNFAMGEQYPLVLDHWAAQLISLYPHLLAVDVCVGAPMGGILFAGALARALSCRVIFLEKKITALATKDSREKSVLTLNRHEVREEDRLLLVEDVCTNFSTTAAALAVAEVNNAEFVAISCILNRSPDVIFSTWNGADGERILPVRSIKHRPTKQYRQDDPVVADDIRGGNVVWKPKNEWKRLQAVMKEYEQ